MTSVFKIDIKMIRFSESANATNNNQIVLLINDLIKVFWYK